MGQRFGHLNSIALASNYNLLGTTPTRTLDPHASHGIGHYSKQDDPWFSS